MLKFDILREMNYGFAQDEREVVLDIIEHKLGSMWRKECYTDRLSDRHLTMSVNTGAKVILYRKAIPEVLARHTSLQDELIVEISAPYKGKKVLRNPDAAELVQSIVNHYNEV